MEAIYEQLNAHFPEYELAYTPSESGLSYLEVPPAYLHEVCFFLHTNPQYYFDHLACLTALDERAAHQRFELVYNLYSIPNDLKLNLRVCVPESDAPQVPSVADIWRAADWHEREAYDLMGIHFTNHPDLRRILLPEDWEGHPLRKDYSEQEKYHGITVRYDRDDT